MVCLCFPNYKTKANQERLSRKKLIQYPQLSRDPLARLGLAGYWQEI